MAILVDIRRDNLLLHLLFKALFAEAAARAEYLALLTGRSPPSPHADRVDRPLEDIVAHLDQQRPRPSAELAPVKNRLGELIASFGVPLTEDDSRTIRRFHRRFVAGGLSLQFNSRDRPPQWDYPTYRDLLLETDRDGRRRSFLANHLVRLEEAGYVKIEKTFRGKVPLTVCNLTNAGRTAFETYRETFKRALR